MAVDPTKDEHRSGRPVNVSVPEMIDKIRDMVLNDRKIKLCIELSGDCVK